MEFRPRVKINHQTGTVSAEQSKGTGQENADFILTIPKSGSYQISVTGYRAKGEISFTCIPLKEE
jgi:hypothetical protein